MQGDGRDVISLSHTFGRSATGSGREPDSDFEIEVSDALRHRGYDVVAQGGIAGYFMHLAVSHFENLQETDIP